MIPDDGVRMHHDRAMVRFTAISCTNFDRKPTYRTGAGLAKVGPKIAQGFLKAYSPGCRDPMAAQIRRKTNDDWSQYGWIHRSRA